MDLKVLAPEFISDVYETGAIAIFQNRTFLGEHKGVLGSCFNNGALWQFWAWLQITVGMLWVHHPGLAASA